MRRDTEHDQYDGRRDLGLGGKCQPYRKAFRAISQADSKLCGDPYVAALSRKSFISSSSICLFSPLSEGVLTSVLLLDLESQKRMEIAPTPKLDEVESINFGNMPSDLRVFVEEAQEIEDELLDTGVCRVHTQYQYRESMTS